MSEQLSVIMRDGVLVECAFFCPICGTPVIAAKNEGDTPADPLFALCYRCATKFNLRIDPLVSLGRERVFWSFWAETVVPDFGGRHHDE